MKVIYEYPPNIEKIKKVLSIPESGVVFTYGDTIYNPSKGTIDELLEKHEEVHMKQQTDPEEWWSRYLTDITFRASQELEAYRAQYKEAKKVIKDRNILFKYLKLLAKDFSSEQYGNPMSFEQAIKEIQTT